MFTVLLITEILGGIMKTLRWMIPAFALALLPLWACEADEGDQASDTLIIEDTEPDIIVEDQEPDVIIEDTDGVEGEIRIDDEGLEGEVKVEDN